MTEAIRELERFLRSQEAQDREIRALKLRLDKIATPNGGIRETVIIGVTPPPGGGTGTTGDIKGSVTIWQNASGATRTLGTVVVENGNRTFGVTTTIGNPLLIGVLNDASVIVGGEGHIRHGGYQNTVKTQGVVAVGDFLRTSATVERAESAGTSPVDGAFAIALTASGGGAATVAAYLFPPVRLGSFAMRERAFTVGIAGAIPVAGVEVADFTFIAPHAGTAKRLKAAVKTAVGVIKTLRVRSRTPPGGAFADFGAFVISLDPAFDGGFTATPVNPADLAFAENDVFQIEVEDANVASGANLTLELVYEPI